MLRFPKRSRSVARIAVGLVALGVPLLGASAAQAAIGTANQVTTNLPDQRTSTILPLFNEVEICFDQPIDLADPDPGDVLVGGYLGIPLAGGGPPVITSSNCIKSQFAGTTNLEATTFAQVAAGTVKNLTSAPTNLTDSTPLIGSTTQNGTRGNSIHPDLISVILNEGQNQIAYLHDEEINTTTSPACGLGANPNFAFYDSQGAVHTDGTVLSCSNTSGLGAVLVDFPDATSPVTTARRAYTNPGQLIAASPSGAFFGPNTHRLSVVVPGTNGSSNDPDMLSAELQTPNGSGNQMLFTYDENLANDVDSAFNIELANGVRLTSTTAQIINGNQVLASFGGGAELVSEYWVAGFARFNAVEGSDDNAPAPPNGLPSGGNAGAFALGYTTGPDPLNASANDGNGQVTILMDQRMISAPVNAQLIDDDGLTGVFGTATSIGALGVPGQYNIVYQFPQSDLAAAVGVQLPIGGVFATGALVGSPDANPTQNVGIR